MSHMTLDRANVSATVSFGATWLYTVGQVAVWAALLVFRRWLSSEFMLFRMMSVIRSGPKAIPTTAVDCFALLQAHPLLGFSLLNGFDMVNFVLAGVVVLVLYAVLKRTDRSFMMLAVAFMLVAIVVYIRSNPALPMLALGHQYAAASTDAQQAALVSAGEAVLVAKSPFALGQNVAFVFFHAAGLMVSLVMLRSGIFSKRCAILGMLFNAFGLGFPLSVALAPGSVFLPGAAWTIGVIFWVFWYIGIARTFHRLSAAVKGQLRGNHRPSAASHL
jgi:hypothetical protein